MKAVWKLSSVLLRMPRVSRWHFVLRSACRALFGGLILIGTVACAPSELTSSETVQPNVILITIDTIRADHCSSYGYKRLTTPVLSRVAEAGVIFRDAYAPTATTAPSHASLFTSLYPRSHGVMKNGLTLKPQFQTLAEEMQAAGYQTAAIVASFPVSARFGLNQGMDYYDDAFEADGREPRERKWEGTIVNTPFDRDAKITTRNAEMWIRQLRNEEQPFFLWVHYYDPHSPYKPHESFEELFLGGEGDRPARGSVDWKVAMYDAEIRETDDSIGRLLTAVEEEVSNTSTVVIITGDHGEGLMQHGHLTHGIHLYEEAVRVPLVIQWQGVLPAGGVVREPVQLIDVMPTILEITGVEHDGSNHKGESLLGVMKGDKTLDASRDIFLERRMYKNRQVGQFLVNGAKVGVRSGSWKYIEAREESTRELYNLESDSHEMTNLADAYPLVAARFSEKLAEWSRVTPIQSPTSDPGLTDQDLELLRAMGYIE